MAGEPPVIPLDDPNLAAALKEGQSAEQRQAKNPFEPEVHGGWVMQGTRSDGSGPTYTMPVQGPLTTFAQSFTNLAAPNAVNYLAAGDKTDPSDQRTYADKVAFFKKAQEAAQSANPKSHWLGTALGVIPAVAEDYLLKGYGPVIQGGLMGATAGDTLENYASGKSGALPLVLQTGAGMMGGKLIAGATNKAAEVISPSNIRDAAHYAWQAGISLPSTIMNSSLGTRVANSLNGMKYLTQQAGKTADEVGERIAQFSGGVDPRSAFRDAAEYFAQTAPSNYSTLSRKLSNAVNRVEKAFGTYGSGSPELAAAAQTMYNTFRRMSPAEASTFSRVVSRAEPVWENFQNGLIGSFRDVGDRVHFGNLSNAWDDLSRGASDHLLRGKDAAQGFLQNVRNMSTTLTKANGGVNPIDKVVHAARPAPAAGSRGINDVLRDHWREGAAYLGSLASGFFDPRYALTGAAVTAATKYAAAPTVARTITNNAASRPAAKEGLSQIVRSTGPALIRQKASDAYDWAAKKFHDLTGYEVLRAVMRTSGGQVMDDGLERLVSGLMIKAKKAKMAQAKSTEPMLDQHDDTIAKALNVAQKAI